MRQGDGVRILANGRRLVISRAQVSDTALFQCVASNEAGEQERDFKVAVHGNRVWSILIEYLVVICVFGVLVAAVERQACRKRCVYITSVYSIQYCIQIYTILIQFEDQ